MSTAQVAMIAVTVLALLAGIGLAILKERRARRRRRGRRPARGADTVYSAFPEEAAANEADYDPLGEAEIYLAYGNRKMALSVLGKAAQEHPERSDIRDKIRQIEEKDTHAPNDKPG